MELPSWLGLPTLRFGRGNAKPVHGLVLAGGGAKASFQIGALRHLYDVVGISPTVISATSAGSVVACSIAQWPDSDAQSHAVRQLESMWLAMQEQSDMFARRAWFNLLLDKAPDWMKLVERDRRRTPVGLSLPRLNLPFTHSSEGDAVVDPADPRAGEDDDRIAAPLTGQAATLEIATKDIASTADAASWNPSVMLQLLGVLSRLTRDGGDIQAILRGADASGSTYRAGPLLAKLLDPSWFRSERLASSGVTLRIATVALESGELRFMTEKGTLVDRDNQPVSDTRHEVTKGVLASCSVPGVFRPVEIDGEHYVDGGVRENVPAEIAIGHLGATHPYVITCSPQGSTGKDFGSRNMLDLATRSIEILTDETERDEVAYAINAGAVVIAPEIAVHSSMTVDPGLLRINRDYGWMTSARVHAESSAADRQLINELVRLRMRGWELEKGWLASTATRADMDELEQTKRQLVAAAARLPRELRPDGIESWGRELEAHGHMAEGLTPPWVV
ncbi:MAG: patatin-like phospholipase family protein [Acidipropionibacterium acidipropionici]|jgi:NTE family protein|uniref:patatin-like phospholipase family protein n=1 Tax=Acidipropionibacterium acidipropionici TaxID=1748 RepID=UPI002F36080B